MHQSPFEAVGPVLETRLHVGGVPLELAAPLDQLFAEVHRLDEPLAAGQDLERAVALFVELDRVRDGPRLAHEVARLAELLDDDRLRLRRGQTARADRSSRWARAGVDRFPARRPPGDRTERAVRLNDGANRQAQLAPPGDVGDVAERADHRDAAALFRIGQRMRP